MSPIARVAAGLVRAYQLIVSPWVTVSCKYYPSCSAYALEAVQTHGALRGLRLAGWRLLRCNPWSDGGVDHVPGHLSKVAVSEVAVSKVDVANTAAAHPNHTDQLART